MGHSVSGSLKQAADGGVARALQRETEGKLVGGTVALDDHAAQSQQGRSIVSAIVHALAQAVQDRQSGEACQPGQY